MVRGIMSLLSFPDSILNISIVSSVLYSTRNILNEIITVSKRIPWDHAVCMQQKEKADIAEYW